MLRGYQILLVTGSIGAPTPADDAVAIAARDYAAALAADKAGRPREAARRFLDCASRFAAVVPGDAAVETTIYDAQVCYDDAIYAFAAAHALAGDGRAALEAAAARDPRNADFIHAELASNSDDPACDP
jgi:hypothetical protein